MSHLQVVATVFAATVAACTLIGLAVRYVLVPYLDEKLIKPLEETHRQVSVNGGQNNPPTLLDKVGATHELAVETRDMLTTHLIEAAGDHARLGAVEARVARLER